MSDNHVTDYLCEQIDHLRAQLADRDAEIQRLRTQAGLDSSQREDELRAQLAEAQAALERLRLHAIGKMQPSAAGLAIDLGQERDGARYEAHVAKLRAEKAEAALAQAQAEAGALREELSLMVSYLAHQDQDADHAWMAEHMRKAALSSTSGRALLERVRQAESDARVLAHSYEHDSRPPDEIVKRAARGGQQMKFRKKPVEIEAMRFDGNNGFRICDWSGGQVVPSPVLEPTEANLSGAYLQIETLEGCMTAIVGDWIIRGVAGEFYPCKPDIFAATYEPIEEDSHE